MRFACCVLALVASCGDDNKSVVPDAPAKVTDAAIDSPSAAGCDYTEQADITNDDFSGNVPNSVPETSGAFTGATRVLCGTLDSTHFVAADELVDIDGYTFIVTTESDVRIDLVSPGAQALDYLSIDVYRNGTLDNVGTTAKFVGDHAVLDVHLAAGSYELLVFAANPAAITTALPYRATFRVDTPATRCAKLTGAGSYAETRDTAANNHAANDMILIANPTLTLTASTTDLPEPTALTLGANSAYLVTGTSADLAVTSGYRDRDTFQVQTGPTTNELAVRLNWAGTTADLDFFVLEAGIVPQIGRAIEAVKAEPELKTFGVKPSTSYWILVGNDGSSAAGAVPYGLSICGAQFTP